MFNLHNYTHPSGSDSSVQEFDRGSCYANRFREIMKLIISCALFGRFFICVCICASPFNKALGYITVPITISLILKIYLRDAKTEGGKKVPGHFSAGQAHPSNHIHYQLK